MRTYDEIKKGQLKLWGRDKKIFIEQEWKDYIEERTQREVALWERIESVIAWEKERKQTIEKKMIAVTEHMVNACREKQQIFISELEQLPETMKVAETVYATVVEEKITKKENRFSYDQYVSVITARDGIAIHYSPSGRRETKIYGLDSKCVNTLYELARKNELIAKSDLEIYSKNSLLIAIGKNIDKLVQADNKGILFTPPEEDMRTIKIWVWDDSEGIEKNSKAINDADGDFKVKFEGLTNGTTLHYKEKNVATSRVENMSTMSEEDFAQKVVGSRNTEVVSEWIVEKVEKALETVAVGSHNRYKEIQFSFTIYEKQVELEIEQGKQMQKSVFDFAKHQMSFLNGDVMCKGLAKAVMSVTQLKFNEYALADIKYVQFGKRYKVVYQEINSEYTGVSDWV